MRQMHSYTSMTNAFRQNSESSCSQLEILCCFHGNQQLREAQAKDSKQTLIKRRTSPSRDMSSNNCDSKIRPIRFELLDNPLQVVCTCRVLQEMQQYFSSTVITAFNVTLRRNISLI